MNYDDTYDSNYDINTLQTQRRPHPWQRPISVHIHDPTRLKPPITIDEHPRKGISPT